VTGFGQASAPAETATIQILVGDPNAAGFAIATDIGAAPVQVDPVPPTAPANTEQGATTVVEGSVSSEDMAPLPPQTVEPLTEADLAPIIQALTTSGVPAEQIQTTLPPAMAGPFIDPLTAGAARIDVTLSSPTVDGISALLTAVSNAAIANNLGIFAVGVGYDVADCQTLREQAQRAAIDNAAAQAQSLASLLGVTLGEIVFASEFSYSPTASTTGACAATTDPSRSAVGGPQIILPPFDPSQPAEAEVYSTLYLVYAIQSQ
jgi:hypothetical protein